MKTRQREHNQTYTDASATPRPRVSVLVKSIDTSISNYRPNLRYRRYGWRVNLGNSVDRQSCSRSATRRLAGQRHLPLTWAAMSTDLAEDLAVEPTWRAAMHRSRAARVSAMLV
jgi:hypothetical protein